MSPSSHQTARLSRGKHRGPDDGTCVMELSSMLAGEDFSDHPRSVCPIVAGFLRNYNDGVDDEQRDDLYRFAAEAVGTRAGADVTAARARLCHEWIADLRGELLPGPGRVLAARLRWWPVLTARPDDPSVGALAGRLAARAARRRRPGAHASSLALVERMLAAGREGRPDGPGSRADGTTAVTTAAGR